MFNLRSDSPEMKKVVEKKQQRIKKTIATGDKQGRNTISCSIKQNSYNNVKSIKALNHNLRLTWQASVIKGKEHLDYWITNGNTNDETIRIQKLDGRQKKKERKEIYRNQLKDLLYSYEEHNKKILNNHDDPKNFDINGKFRGQNSKQHNLLSEAVIHIGAGHSDLLKQMKGKPMKVAIDNVKLWLKDMGLRQDIIFPVISLLLPISSSIL